MICVKREATVAIVALAVLTTAVLGVADAQLVFLTLLVVLPVALAAVMHRYVRDFFAPTIVAILVVLPFCYFVLAPALRGIGVGAPFASAPLPVAFSIWAFVAPPAVGVLFRFLREERFPSGRCQRCGYDLSGNVSGRCPECGERRRFVGFQCRGAVRRPWLPAWFCVSVAVSCFAGSFVLGLANLLIIAWVPLDGWIVYTGGVLLFLAMAGFMLVAFVPSLWVYRALRWRRLGDDGERCWNCGCELTGRGTELCAECTKLTGEVKWDESTYRRDRDRADDATYKYTSDA